MTNNYVARYEQIPNPESVIVLTTPEVDLPKLVFVPRTYGGHYIDGTIYEVSTWEGPDKVLGDLEFIVSGSIKWDGCAHLNFEGQDVATDHGGGYYHYCLGPLDHIRALVWLYDIASRYLKTRDIARKLQYGSEVMQLLMKDCVEAGTIPEKE